MASPRDSRGRFVKAGSSTSSVVDQPAPSAPQPCPLPNLERIAMDQQQLMEKLVAQYEAAARENEAKLVAQYEAAARENEARMKAAVDLYEQLMQSAQSSLEGLLTTQAAQSPSGSAGMPQLPPPAPPPPAPAQQESAPAAVWIKAPDGENFLLVNQAGAVMFLAIFERIGVVFEELMKLAPKRPGR